MAPTAARATKVTSWVVIASALGGLPSGGPDGRGSGPALRDATVCPFRQLLLEDPVQGFLIGLDLHVLGARRRRGRGRCRLRGCLDGGGWHGLGCRGRSVARCPRRGGGGDPRGERGYADLSRGSRRFGGWRFGGSFFHRRLGALLERRGRKHLVRPLLKPVHLVGHLEDVVLCVL